MGFTHTIAMRQEREISAHPGKYKTLSALASASLRTHTMKQKQLFQCTTTHGGDIKFCALRGVYIYLSAAADSIGPKARGGTGKRMAYGTNKSLFLEADRARTL
jgi:hypothetical protein